MSKFGRGQIVITWQLGQSGRRKRGQLMTGSKATRLIDTCGKWRLTWFYRWVFIASIAVWLNAGSDRNAVHAVFSTSQLQACFGRKHKMVLIMMCLILVIVLFKIKSYIWRWILTFHYRWIFALCTETLAGISSLLTINN